MQSRKLYPDQPQKQFVDLKRHAACLIFVSLVNVTARYVVLIYALYYDSLLVERLAD